MGEGWGGLKFKSGLSCPRAPSPLSCLNPEEPGGLFPGDVKLDLGDSRHGEGHRRWADEASECCVRTRVPAALFCLLPPAAECDTARHTHTSGSLCAHTHIHTHRARCGKIIWRNLNTPFKKSVGYGTGFSKVRNPASH